MAFQWGEGLPGSLHWRVVLDHFHVACLEKLTTLYIYLGFVQGSETTLQSTYSDTSAQPTCDYGKCGPLGTGGCVFCFLVAEQSSGLLVAFNIAVTLSFPNANLCEMVWWALRIATEGLELPLIMGKVSVIEQAGVLGCIWLVPLTLWQTVRSTCGLWQRCRFHKSPRERVWGGEWPKSKGLVWAETEPLT